MKLLESNSRKRIRDIKDANKIKKIRPKGALSKTESRVSCVSCHRNNPDKDVVELSKATARLGGKAQICENCVEKASVKLGWGSPRNTAQIVQEQEELLQKIEEAEKANAKLAKENTELLTKAYPTTAGQGK